MRDKSKKYFQNSQTTRHSLDAGGKHESDSFVGFQTRKNREYSEKEYEIWTGYYSLGQGMDDATTVRFIGKQKGRNFQDACAIYHMKEAITSRERAWKEGSYYDTSRFDYRWDTNTYWGIEFFPSKEEAQAQIDRILGKER